MRKLLLLLTVLICGCSPRANYIPSRIGTDTVYKSVNRVDSIYLRDSVYVNIYTNNDTIYKEKVKVKFREKVMIKNDTIFKSRIDSVKVSIPVEKHLTMAQNMRMALGDVFAIILLLFTSIIGIRIFLRRFNR